jgi:hypothetical protein
VDRNNFAQPEQTRRLAEIGNAQSLRCWTIQRSRHHHHFLVRKTDLNLARLANLDRTDPAGQNGPRVKTDRRRVPPNASSSTIRRGPEDETQ